MDSEAPPAADVKHRWPISLLAAVGGVVALTVVILVWVWNSPSDDRWGLNTASALSFGLGLLAILITVSIYHRQRLESAEAEERYAKLLEGVSRSADRAARLATTEQMLNAAQHLRRLMPSQAQARRVARDLLHASDRKEPPRVLWVDDDPGSVWLETEILETSGVHTDSAEDTEQAMTALDEVYDIVISDMRRGSNRTAGYDLLERMKSQACPASVVFYTGSNDPAHDREAQQHGALGSTDDPVRLFEIVVASLGGLKDARPPRRLQ